MRPVLLCEPNINEGCNHSLIEHVCRPIRETPEVKLLDCSSDSDHNRTVLTYLGDSRVILAVTQSIVTRAFGEIDMAKHKVHIRA